LQKSPTLSAQTIKEDKTNDINKKQAFNFLQKLSGKEDGKELKKINVSNLSGFKSELSKNYESSTPSPNLKQIQRKTVIDLKDLESNIQRKDTKEYSDLPITPAFSIKKTLTLASNHSDKKDDNLINVDIVESFENLQENEEEVIVKYEGYIYKLTDTKRVKKLWFKLVHRDFYYFKNENDQIHKGMHNISGVFVKEENKTTLEGKEYFTFSMSYPKKTRYYFVEKEDEFKNWVASIQRATNYSNLNDIYEVKEKLGNGKFGLVRLGIHKETGRKVAVKIMSKKDMDHTDLELVRTEIEILKICQHPNIIKLYDVFENLEYIYIIMEHCSGGDLFSYIEKRGFKLPEKQACTIIRKLCEAIYYVHSYGIAHRDIKPENILMTDDTEYADIKLLDFGLSKIVGPSQNCNEPYGTLSYVAPEVLLEKPYSKAVDMWSIGITTYLLLSARLPFDDEFSKSEIARQTIHDPIYWGSIWKKLSFEAKMFVDDLLQKDPEKRITIKQALEHPWIIKFNTKTPTEERKKTTTQSTFKFYSSTEELEKEKSV